MTTDFGAQLRRARERAGITVRELAAAAGVATGTITRYERGGPYTTATLLRVADALGVTVDQDPSGVWTVRAQTGESGTPDGAGIDTVSATVTDGSTVLTLRVPPGFLEGLGENERREVEADALLEVMRLAREARRRSSTS